MSGSSLTPETAAAINEARLQLVQELHCAVHGDTWARPLSPEQVWLDLLDHVRRLVAVYEALQNDEQPTDELEVTIHLDWGSPEELSEFVETLGDFVMESGRIKGSHSAEEECDCRFKFGFASTYKPARSVGVPTNPEEARS